MKKMKYIIAFLTFALVYQAKAQTNVSQQLNNLPGDLSNYIHGYLHDLSSLQGISYLNSVNTTGGVLGKWELNLSVKAGSAFTASPYTISTHFSDNFEMRGSASSLFGSDNEGEFFFKIIDEVTGAGYVDPFTGEEIGFSIPFLPGLDFGAGASPALMPVLTLGLGYGTEVSASILPGAIKAASGNISEDFSIDKDMMYSFGIRHDVFSWIPTLVDRNVRLTLGATYNSMTVGAIAGEGLFDDFENTSDDLFSATNNLTGVEYGFNSLGFEAMLSKKLSFVDISLFASTNKADYFIQSKGNIVVSVANSFYSNQDLGVETTTLNDLIDIEATTKRVIYGAAIQFNLGRFNLGFKGGLSDEFYGAVSLGFKILKNKNQEIME